MEYDFHRRYSVDINRDNVKAGWWTDLKTNTPLKRNFGEMVALVHSELSECYQGISLNLQDDHLPQLPMYKVEIADACIRVYDILGGMFMGIPEYTTFTLDMPQGFLSVEFRLLYLHGLLSYALEHFRKGHRAETKMLFYRFLDACFEWAEGQGWDLEEVINLKREYNRSRADHKLENRSSEEGKKF